MDALNSLRTLLEWQRELVDNLLSYEGTQACQDHAHCAID